MVAAWAASRENQVLQTKFMVLYQRQAVSGVVPMIIFQEAGEAEIVIVAMGAGDHLGLSEF
jgi:hypothetical protein